MTRCEIVCNRGDLLLAPPHIVPGCDHVCDLLQGNRTVFPDGLKEQERFKVNLDTDKCVMYW